MLTKVVVYGGQLRERSLTPQNLSRWANSELACCSTHYGHVAILLAVTLACSSAGVAPWSLHKNVAIIRSRSQSFMLPKKNTWLPDWDVELASRYRRYIYAGGLRRFLAQTAPDLTFPITILCAYCRITQLGGTYSASVMASMVCILVNACRNMRHCVLPKTRRTAFQSVCLDVWNHGRYARSSVVTLPQTGLMFSKLFSQ